LYSTLGIAPGASRAEIRRAYRHRALEVHPDIAGSDTTADMAALNDARDRLLARTGAGRAPASGDPADEGPHTTRPPAEPSFSHAPTWDDYWAAWNDPPRRPRP
jgi:molecular chaperone DnaJ